VRLLLGLATASLLAEVALASRRGRRRAGAAEADPRMGSGQPGRAAAAAAPVWAGPALRCTAALLAAGAALTAATSLATDARILWVLAALGLAAAAGAAWLDRRDFYEGLAPDSRRGRS
jgi:hypothetical protein